MFLIVGISSLVIYAKSLESKTSSLEKQIAELATVSEETCTVNSAWLAGSSTTRTELGRQYIVHLPAEFKPDVYYPLVMLYPGKGATAEAAQYAYAMDALPAIITYPSPTVGADGFTAWQGAPYSSRSNDIAFTNTILDRLQADLCIDKTRIYAVGMSNGGGFASLLSCKAADRFAAFAIVSGAFYQPFGHCEPTVPRPVINVHGDSDPLVPYEGSPQRKLMSVDSWAQARAHSNDCKSSTTINQSYNQAVTTWTNCRHNATVKNIKVVGGGHGWGQVSNDEIWNFLSQYSL